MWCSFLFSVNFCVCLGRDTTTTNNKTMEEKRTYDQVIFRPLTDLNDPNTPKEVLTEHQRTLQGVYSMGDFHLSNGDVEKILLGNFYTMYYTNVVKREKEFTIVYISHSELYENGEDIEKTLIPRTLCEYETSKYSLGGAFRKLITEKLFGLFERP